jgi:trimeric autotransporter adhesin
MKKKNYPGGFVLLLLFISLPFISTSQITGTVFRDINNDGIRQSINPTEPGEYGIVVRAYNAANVVLASVTTNASGNFSITAAQVPSGTAVRVEFILSAGDFPSKRINANRSNIQFVTAGAAAVNIDFAIASKKLLSDNSNPYVATTAYVNGDASAISGVNAAGQYDNLHIFPYDLSNDGGISRRTKNQYTGSVFGLAWQKESRTLFMSAYLKRHAGFGPNGIGAIYKSQISKTGNPSTPSLLVDVSSIGINVGTNPRISTLPANASTPNTDDGVFANVGKTGIGSIELSDDGRDLYIVNMFQKKLHRINIGNPLKSSFTAADVTGNWNIPDPGIAGTVWHPMALKIHNHKFYIGGVCVKETTGLHNIADTANMRGIVYQFDPATNLFTEVLRFPLTYRKGFSNNDGKYEFRNNYWSAWQNNGDISYAGPLRTGLIYNPSAPFTAVQWATALYYAQPMLSAIEFDIDGSMIIGIRDRFGDQGGYANYFETGNVAGETYRTLSSGEVLRAGKSGSAWVFENAGAVTSNGVTTTTPGVTDNNPAMTGSFNPVAGTPWGGSYGPGGGYYYYNHNFSLLNVPAPFNAVVSNINHYLKSNGGLAYLPGYNEVMTSAIDPMNIGYSNGLIKNVNTGAQAGNMSARMNLIVNPTGDPAYMGKSASLGDLEILLDAEAMEIGNRVWQDINTNGVQDANEPGIAGVVVVLRSPGTDNVYNNGNDQTWTVTTDANGNYYFDETIVNDNRRPVSWLGVSSVNSGILPGFEYRIEIAGSQLALANLYLTIVNASTDAISSKGVKTGADVHYIINPGGSTAAGSSFENNYNIDFGYTSIPLPLTLVSFTAQLNTDNIVDLKWETVTEINVSHFEIEKSTDGISFSKAGIVSAKGNTEDITRYSMKDMVNGNQSSLFYYRLRSVDKDGKSELSKIRIIRINKQSEKNITILTYPNPVSNEVRITIPPTWQNKKVVYEIFNASGQTIKRVETSSSSQTETMNVSSLSPGFYLVRVKFNGQIAQQKIVKQ